MALKHQLEYSEKLAKDRAASKLGGKAAGRGRGKAKGWRAKPAREPSPLDVHYTTFLVKAPMALVERLEKARAARGLRSRNDAVVAILDEGAPK